MSFGFGVGDFLAVGTLAWKIYRACKDMKDEFFEISKEALAVHILLQELQDEAKDEHSVLNVRGRQRRPELMTLVANLKGTLQQLDEIINRYKGLARRERRIWNELRLANEDLNRIRSKLNFHIDVINGFMDSLSRSTLARIEQTLLEVLRETQKGQRPPTIASIDRPDDVSGWKELESELAEEGIIGADVAKHKAAIRVFILSRLRDSSTDDMSLDDVASVVESSHIPDTFLDKLAQSDPGSQRPSRVPTAISLGNDSVFSLESQQTFRTAPEGPADEQTAVNSTFHVSFAPFARIPAPENKTEESSTIDKRLGLIPIDKSGERNIYRYRHSVDVTGLSPDSSLLPTIPAQMVLILDPTHSSISKLAHAFLRHLTKTHAVVAKEIDTVRSTGWRTHMSGGIDMLSVDSLIRGLLARKKIEAPKLEAYAIAPFRFADLAQFDHIIYFNSPTFRQYLEENIKDIAKMKETYFKERDLAILTKYETPANLRLPDEIALEGALTEMHLNRQRLALEDVYRVVQRFMLDFLLQEYGLRKTGQGFEKLPQHRRLSKGSSLSLDRKTSPVTIG